MLRSKAQKSVLTWLACLAIAFGALAPTISHALQRTDLAAQAEICSAAGNTLNPALDPSGKSVPGTLAMKHCPYCSVHAPGVAIPPQSSALPFVLSAPADLPVPYLDAPRTLHAWASANPRAPPRRA